VRLVEGREGEETALEKVLCSRLKTERGSWRGRGRKERGRGRTNTLLTSDSPKSKRRAQDERKSLAERNIRGMEFHSMRGTTKGRKKRRQKKQEENEFVHEEGM
jgi:hypothetical protein